VLRGITEEKAIGKFDEALQRLYLETQREQLAEIGMQSGIAFIRWTSSPKDTVEALRHEDRPCVLLVDELIRSDQSSRRSY